MIRVRFHVRPRAQVEHERRVRVSRWGVYVVARHNAYVLTWWEPAR